MPDNRLLCLYPRRPTARRRSLPLSSEPFQPLESPLGRTRPVPSLNLKMYRRAIPQTSNSNLMTRPDSRQAIRGDRSEFPLPDHEGMVIAPVYVRSHDLQKASATMPAAAHRAKANRRIT